MLCAPVEAACWLQVTGDAQRKAASTKDQAAQAAEDARAAAEDTLSKGQAHGESAWQKAKEAVGHAYEQARACCHVPLTHK